MSAKKTKSTNGDGEGVLPKLKAIYGFMTENNLETLELDEEGTHVKMVRRRAAGPVQIPVPVPVMTAGAAPAAPAAAHSQAPAQPEAAPANTVAIKSTMMGIFYRAPTPSSPPFVKEGDAVKPGQVLCMVEAMKVFNEIKAEFACTIVKTMVDNGKPVKAGQDLFAVQRQ